MVINKIVYELIKRAREGGELAPDSPPGSATDVEQILKFYQKMCIAHVLHLVEYSN